MFNKGEVNRTRWMQDYTMATMPKGSLLAMIISNARFQQDVVLGIVKNDIFRIEHHRNLEKFTL
jgi:hypothetical protein